MNELALLIFEIVFFDDEDEDLVHGVIGFFK
jgi:hypothetical protein